MLDWDAANPGIQDWRNRPGFGIPGLQSLVVLFTATTRWLTMVGMLKSTILANFCNAWLGCCQSRDSGLAEPAGIRYPRIAIPSCTVYSQSAPCTSFSGLFRTLVTFATGFLQIWFLSILKVDCNGFYSIWCFHVFFLVWDCENCCYLLLTDKSLLWATNKQN